MSEWPKHAYVEGDGFNPDHGAPIPSDLDGPHEVIPADLGRELYEALKEVPDGTALESLRIPNALARYEREVDRGDH